MTRTRHSGELPSDVTVYGSPLLGPGQSIVGAREVYVPAEPPSHRQRLAYEAWHHAQGVLARRSTMTANA